MNSNETNRRDFLKAGSAALAATTVTWNAKAMRQSRERMIA